jgi:alanine racemase
VPSSRLDIDLSSIERNLRIARALSEPDLGAQASPRRRSGPGPSSGVQNTAPNTASPAPTSPGRTSGGGTGVSICAVLKQDAYGCGAVRVGKRLVAAGAEMLSVYTLDEARVLADAISSVPILVLMPLHGIDRHDPIYRHASSGRVHVTVHGLEQLASMNDTAARVGIPLPVHVQVDTGLSRGGSAPEESVHVLERVLNSGKLRLAGLMTHFASPCCDEDFTREQARVFREFVEHVKPSIRNAITTHARVVGGQSAVHDIALHAANSCAAFRSRSLHGSMLRLGQALYGYLADDQVRPEGFEFAEHAAQLQPALRWTSQIVHVQEIPAGWPVGYGSTWRAPYRADGRKTRIALVPVGYADGYPRALSGEGQGGRAHVGLTGRLWDRRGTTSPSASPAGEIIDPAFSAHDSAAMPTVFAPVVGRVSMDQITIDVTDVPESYLRFGSHTGPTGEVVGSEVELFGRDRSAPNFIGALAQAAGSITHELVCRIGPRVERVYRVQAQPGSGSGSGSGEAVIKTTAGGPRNIAVA